MTVTGGPEHTEPTIPVRSSVAFAWADATKRNNNGRRAIVNALLDDIEAHRPPPPMPDIEWRPGARVQRRGAEGQGVGPVWLLRATVGELVDVHTGAEAPARVRYEHLDIEDPSGMYLGSEVVAWLHGHEWRLVLTAPDPGARP